ncbi:MAG: hypothetical protein J6R46_08000, partial [Clostridia bacterium]|nr:hypothetical protein [Clostridia bacterium]
KKITDNQNQFRPGAGDQRSPALCIAVRESNQVGFDGQIFPIPAAFPLDILPVCPAGKAFGIEKICFVKTARTRGRMHF